MKLYFNFDAEGNPLHQRPVIRSLPRANHRSDVCGILIVEDEKFWRQLFKLNLFKHPKNKKRKFTFSEASNGREGVKAIAQHFPHIQVVLLDLVMDKMGGMELLRLINKWGLPLGIFILTAYGDEKTMAESQLRGVRGFYDKEYLDFEKLSDDIETYLDLTEQEQGPRSGFYVEMRPHQKGEYQQVYLRWQNTEGRWETFYLGKSNEIETLALPNLRTKGTGEG
jgi:CheY-like chemotaxis protein